MSVTINITKLHLAIAVIAIAVLAPATAFATDIFADASRCVSARRTRRSGWFGCKEYVGQRCWFVV